MELFAMVQPLVRTRQTYQDMYGDEDPEELERMEQQDRDLAERIDGVLYDLYGLQTNLAEARDGEGLDEYVGGIDELHELRAIAASINDKTEDDYHEGNVAPGFPFNHLINHADDEGFYLPVDFLQAFVMEEISIGSAVALLRELEALEPVLADRYPDQVALALTTPDDEERAPIEGPVGVWHSLRRLCRSAIALNMPVQLG